MGWPTRADNSKVGGNGNSICHVTAEEVGLAPSELGVNVRCAKDQESGSSGPVSVSEASMKVEWAISRYLSKRSSLRVDGEALMWPVVPSEDRIQNDEHVRSVPVRCASIDFNPPPRRLVSDRV